MVITDVKAIRANRGVFAKVFTNEGIYGIGEAGAWGLLAASATAIEMFRDYLVGKDPLDIEYAALWPFPRCRNYGRNLGHRCGAL